MGRAAKMPYTRMVRGRVQVKIDIAPSLQHLFPRRGKGGKKAASPYATVLCEFPHVTGRSEAEIIADFQRQISEAKASIVPPRHVVVGYARRLEMDRLSPDASARIQEMLRAEFPDLRITERGGMGRMTVMVPPGGDDPSGVVDRHTHQLISPVMISANSRHVGKSVDYNSIISLWQTQLRLDDDDKKLLQMKSKWRRFFIWLVRERGYPVGCSDMGRVTRDDLEAYKDHLFATDAASKTVEDNLRGLSKIFGYAKEKNPLAIDPSDGFRIPKGMTDPANKWIDFSVSEVRHILSCARSAPDEIRWPMWIAAYSGARLAEVVEAQTSDVEIDENGIVIFHIRRVNRPGKQATLKTGAISERPVPLHDAVLSEGFLSYVETIRALHGHEGPLFGQFKEWRGRINTDASLRLNAWLRSIGIEHEKKVFHSWRHTVKTRFRGVDAAGEHYITREDVADKLTGHAGGTIGRNYGYFPTVVLRNAISRVPAW